MMWMSTDLNDLFYAMIMRSDGRYCKFGASMMGGNINHFVSEMNDEASVIGLSSALRDTGWCLQEGTHLLQTLRNYSRNRYRIKIIEFSLRRLMYRQKTERHPDGIKLSNDIISAFNKHKIKNFKVLGGKFGYTKEAGKSIAVLAKEWQRYSHYIGLL